MKTLTARKLSDCWTIEITERITSSTRDDVLTEIRQRGLKVFKPTAAIKALSDILKAIEEL